MDIRVTRVRHAWPERAGFTISRPKGDDSYTFLYFHNPVELLVDGQKVTTAAGSCIIYDRQTPQWFLSKEPLTHDWIHLEGDVPAALREAGLRTDRIYTPQNGRFITDIVATLELEHFSKPQHHQVLTQLKVRELLIRLARACREEVPANVKPAMEKQLLQVRNQVFSSLGTDWTVEKMSALCYLSPSRFHTVYKAQFGISPTEDLIRARIENAKNRLKGEQVSARQVAEDLGYKNVTHFCRQFKKFTGLTPMEYRRNDPF